MQQTIQKDKKQSQQKYSLNRILNIFFLTVFDHFYFFSIFTDTCWYKSYFFFTLILF